MARLAVVGIVVEDAHRSAGKVQSVLTEYGHIVVGRMGIPDREENVSVISLIVKGSNEDISALCGKLGKLSGVTVKSAMTGRVVAAEEKNG